MGFGSEIFIIDTDPKLFAEIIVIGMSGFIIFVLFLLGRRKL